ncbi:MAG: thiol reductant ABC exporter subunit CydC [Chlorobium sp.]|nr:thiol reductant ABC exporter subunit CydC [Chlorobium sp.]MCW8815348.1 thiol reductant ABC exporter subunit CydC [Chlorobium sp.]MCW8819338.1 thiol reductant ABC exporter subunit CydC [Ignavibacteriaceae bacterium]
MKEILRLLQLVRPFYWWMLLAAVLGFASIGSGIGLMLSSAYIIAKAALHPPFQELLPGIAGVRLFGAARGILRYIERLASHNTTFKILSRLRIWFYTSVEPLAPARLMRYKSGDLLQRITGDIDTLETLYARVISPPLTALLVSGLLWVLLGNFSPAFSLVLFCFHAAAALGLPLLTGYLNRGTAAEMSELQSGMQTKTLDCIQGISDLLLFNRLDDYVGQLNELKSRELKLQRKQALIQGSHESLTGLLMNGAVIALVCVLAPQISNGTIDGVYSAVIIIAVMASFEAFLPLPDAVQHLEANATAGKRLFEIVDAQPAVTAPIAPEAFPESSSICFQKVSFSYPETRCPALSDISLTIREGEKVAIVGPSGAGKSTITSLLLRFWEPTEGSITIGGKSIDRLDPESLRSRIGIVSQHTYLFGESIRKNLLLARPDASDEELKKALEFAGLSSCTSRLDQWAGQHGMSLSGGERQRMAIARMLLQDAPIIVLDEATANLDNLTEKSVMQTILKLCSKEPAKSLLVITHRLRDMSIFNRIVVLENGSIQEEGPHETLMKKNGLYASMWSLQHRPSSPGLVAES